MQIPSLKASRRENSGTKAMRKLRAEGHLPGVLYGKGEENINLQFKYTDIEKLVHEASHVVELDMGEAKQTALVRGLQRDHLGDNLQHIDFIRINLDEKVKLHLPLTFVGTPRGASHGGLLEVLHGDVGVHCPAANIPKFIEVEVTQLEVDQSIKYGDLNLPEGADLIANPKGIVVKCAKARRAAALTKAQEAQEATTAGAAAAPAAGAEATPKPEAKK
jgi:large subunit ribosomal protein L25